MHGPRRAILPVAAPLLLAACSEDGGGQPAPVTADERREMDAAAEMLDADSVGSNAVIHQREQP